jgi:hypothetical protein
MRAGEAPSGRDVGAELIDEATDEKPKNGEDNGH